MLCLSVLLASRIESKWTNQVNFFSYRCVTSCKQLSLLLKEADGQPGEGGVWSFSHLCSYLLQVWLISWYSLEKLQWSLLDWCVCVGPCLWAPRLATGSFLSLQWTNWTAFMKEVLRNHSQTRISQSSLFTGDFPFLRPWSDSHCSDLCVHACRQQTVLSVLYSSASKVTFEVGLSQENLNMKRNTHHQRRSSCFHFHEMCRRPELTMKHPIAFPS